MNRRGVCHRSRAGHAFSMDKNVHRYCTTAFIGPRLVENMACSYDDAPALHNPVLAPVSSACATPLLSLLSYVFGSSNKMPPHSPQHRRNPQVPAAVLILLALLVVRIKRWRWVGNAGTFGEIPLTIRCT
ncbi:hypothetical protein CPB84DRAFT_1770042 [Gymnopilus junonius]|uniref:Uncharacterized protein n=1 Tax=Gymnopilus junonius TaxID=109634 RepID=A0A9P5NTZ0_GYMJU|nr:hypothetical protein CPB84DRAFT_1770042 [Gymnopilus junonius]